MRYSINNKNFTRSNLPCPAPLVEVIQTFPLSKPDRIIKGQENEWLAEWHDVNGGYFEIEYTPKGQLEIMTKIDEGIIQHWSLKRV